jgi:hypothetical protein
MNDLNKARATILEVGEEAEAQRIDNFLLRKAPKSHVSGPAQRQCGSIAGA